MKGYGIYLVRWVLSGFVMLPFMLLFEYLGITLSANIILGQLIGACIFYKIDSWIFKS